MTDNLQDYIGPAAGVATSLLWTACMLFFTAAGKRLGPVVVNVTRIFLAIVLLGTTHRYFTGLWIPEAQARQVLFLALSGIVGLTIGDQALFTAFVDIGPRMSALLMTTSPLFAAFLGWIFLGEALHGWAWIGIAMTLGGVAWVVAERRPTVIGETMPHRARGLLLATVGAACQAGGLLLSKQGIGHGWLPDDQHIAPQTATFIRMVFAGAGTLPIIWWYRRRAQKLRTDSPDRTRPTRSSSQFSARRVGYALTLAGAITGPFLGVWMSLVAGDRAPIGIAQTLCSLTPIFLLPATAIVHKERITARALFGALIAVGGSILLFVRGS